MASGWHATHPVPLVKLALTLDSVMEHATGSPSNCIPGAGAWLGWQVDPTHLSSSGTPTSPERPCNIASASHSASLCGEVLDRFCDHAAVCPCARDGNRRHERLPTSSAKPPRKQPPDKEQTGLLQPRLDSDGLPQRASHDTRGKDVIPEARDFAVTCLRPATRNPQHPQHKT